MFLRHEGYLGAIGAFLKGANEEGEGQLYFLYLILKYLQKYAIGLNCNTLQMFLEHEVVISG